MRKWLSNKLSWRLAAALLLVGAGGAAATSLALAQAPAIPHTFFGSLQINGQPAPAGTMLEARINGQFRGCLQIPGEDGCAGTQVEGAYGGPSGGDPKLVVQGSEGEQGATMQFFIKHAQAVNFLQSDQTAVYTPGAGPDELDLSATDTTPPVANAGPDPSAQVGDAVNFDGGGSTDDTFIVSFQWSFGDGASASGVQVSHVYATAGTFTVTLTVTDLGGNTDSDTALVTVTPPAPTTAPPPAVGAPVPADTTPPVANAGPDQSAQVGDPVNFDGGGSTDNIGIVSYQWDFGDGTTASGVQVSHVYAEPGSYTVTLTVADAAGNTASDTALVTIASPPTPTPVPPPTPTATPPVVVPVPADSTPPVANAAPDQSAQVGDPVSFDGGGSTDNIGIVSYQWDFGDGTTASGVQVSHVYAEPGSYTVTLTVADAASNTASDTALVTIASPPTATPTPTATPPPTPTATPRPPTPTVTPTLLPSPATPTLMPTPLPPPTIPAAFKLPSAPEAPPPSAEAGGLGRLALALIILGPAIVVVAAGGGGYYWYRRMRVP